MEYYQNLERETKEDQFVSTGCLCCKKKKLIKSGMFATNCKSIQIYLNTEIRRLSNKNMGVTFFSFETKEAKELFVKYFKDNV